MALHTLKYYSSIKRNRLLIQAIAWMNFKNLMLIQRSQTQKTELYDSVYRKCPEKAARQRHKVD